MSTSVLRAELRAWLHRARAGEEIVITDRGLPVARLLPVDVPPALERLTREGSVTAPRSPVRPRSTVRTRVSSRGSVADLVSRQRR